MENKSRTRKAITNISWSMVYQVVAIICGLITPRLILVAFGSTYNGVINSATQFLSMISILTLGITGATRVALYKTLAINDIDGTSRIMKATVSYMRKVGGIIVAYALVLALIYPYISHNELSNVENSIIVLIVGIGTFAEYFFGISNQTLLQADQANYIIDIFNIVKTILNTIIVAILIKFGLSIFIVKFGSALIFLVCPAVLHVFVRRKYKLNTNCEVDNSAIKGRKAVAFHSVANLIHNNTDLVILTLFAEAKLISVYTVYYLVIGKIKSLMQVFTSGMEAAFANLWVKKEYDSLNKNFSIYEFTLFAFTVIIFSCVAVLIIPFIKIYTSNVNDVNYIRIPFAILVTLAEGMYCLREPYVTLVYATGSYSETKKGALIEALLNFSISLILVWFIGIEGVLVGTLVANTFRTIQFSHYVSKNILHRSLKVAVYRFAWVCLTAAVGISVSLFVSSLLGSPASWSGWLLLGALSFFCISLITVVSSLIFYRNDFFGILSKIFSVIKRR